MLTDKQFSNIEKNGITFELSKDGKYVTLHKKNKFVGYLYNTKNTVFFCGKEFVETTSRDIFEYLVSNNYNASEEKNLSNDEIFEIWKRAVSENKCADIFDKEFNKKDGYFYCAFRRLNLPKSFEDRQNLDKNILDNLMSQNSYATAKEILKTL